MTVVTGGAGKPGRALVAEPLEHSEGVLSVELVRSPELGASSSSRTSSSETVLGPRFEQSLPDTRRSTRSIRR